MARFTVEVVSHNTTDGRERFFGYCVGPDGSRSPVTAPDWQEQYVRREAQRWADIYNSDAVTYPDNYLDINYQMAREREQSDLDLAYDEVSESY